MKLEEIFEVVNDIYYTSDVEEISINFDNDGNYTITLSGEVD